MKRRVLFILLACVPAFTLLAQSNVSSQRSEEIEQGWGIVNLSVANLHDKADFASEMITQALMGMPVKVLQTEGWHRIQTPDDYLSWVHKAGIQCCTRAELDAWNRAEKVVVTAPHGTVYSAPSRKSQPVSDVVASNRLKLLGKKGKYYRVGYPDGREGYLHKSLAMPETTWHKQLKQDAGSILQTAHRFMGIPYLWAGTSTKGVDCSGFVRAVLLMHDIIIPRDASQQAREGERLEIAPDYSNLQPGDLIFFGRKAADGQKERVVHVAFYLGNKRFIHSQGDVRIGSLDPQDELFDAFNLNRLLFATRFLPYINKVEKMNTTDKNPYYNIQP